MASNNPTQNEKELGTSLEEDLARILGSQVNDEPPHTPKRKEPPAAAESVNSSVPQTISSTDVVNKDEIQSGTGAASATVNAAGDGPEQFQLSPRPQVGATAIEEAIPRSSDARAIEEAIPRSSADQGGASQSTHGASAAPSTGIPFVFTGKDDWPQGAPQMKFSPTTPQTDNSQNIILQLQQRMRKMEEEKLQTEQVARQAIEHAEEARKTLGQQKAQMTEEYQQATRTLQDQYNQRITEANASNQEELRTQAQIVNLQHQAAVNVALQQR